LTETAAVNSSFAQSVDDAIKKMGSLDTSLRSTHDLSCECADNLNRATSEYGNSLERLERLTARSVANTELVSKDFASSVLDARQQFHDLLSGVCKDAGTASKALCSAAGEMKNVEETLSDELRKVTDFVRTEVRTQQLLVVLNVVLTDRQALGLPISSPQRRG